MVTAASYGSTQDGDWACRMGGTLNKKTRHKGGSLITRYKLRALPFLFFVLILAVAVRTAALRLVALVFVLGSRCAPFILLLLILIRTVLALPALVFAALSLPVLFVCH